jgi:hypothetical protein
MSSNIKNRKWQMWLDLNHRHNRYLSDGRRGIPFERCASLSQLQSCIADADANSASAAIGHMDEHFRPSIGRSLATTHQLNLTTAFARSCCSPERQNALPNGNGTFAVQRG